MQNKARRNGFCYVQDALISKFSITEVIVIIPLSTEFRQSSLQYCVAYFFSAPKLARLRLGYPMQLGTHNLKKIGIALRFTGRPVKCSILDVVTHPLQGSSESFFRLRIFKEPNAEFFYSVPK